MSQKPTPATLGTPLPGELGPFPHMRSTTGEWRPYPHSPSCLPPPEVPPPADGACPLPTNSLVAGKLSKSMNHAATALTTESCREFLDKLLKGLLRAHA